MEQKSQNLAADAQAVQEIWKSAFEKRVDPQGRNIEQFLLGVNFRIDVAQAFKAVWSTAKLTVKAVAHAASGDIAPQEWIDITIAGYRVVVDTLEAIREKVSDEIYVACAVLAAHEEGLTEIELQQALQEFLHETESVSLPWYIGLTEPILTNARMRLSSSEGFQNLLQGLRDDEWLMEEQNKLYFKPRHFTWGFSESVE